MGINWGKQLLLVAVAAIGAVYQVNKMDMLLQDEESQALKQLSQTVERLSNALHHQHKGLDTAFFDQHSFTLFEGQGWKPKARAQGTWSGFFGPSDSNDLKERVILLMGTPRASSGPPSLFAELFVDPIVRRKEREQRNKPSQNKGKKNKNKPPLQTPLVAIRVHHAALLPITKELEKHRLLSRVISTFSHEEESSSGGTPISEESGKNNQAGSTQQNSQSEEHRAESRKNPPGTTEREAASSCVNDQVEECAL